AQDLFARLHPTPSWVWKDPRLCLTKPFWDLLFAGDAAAVLVLRNPLEVCASLRRRDRIPKQWALALFERYLRQALLNLEGSSVLVTHYESLLVDCEHWCHDLAAFLGGEAPSSAIDHVRQFLRQDLRHVASTDVELKHDPELTKPQVELYFLALECAGRTNQFRCPELP